MALSPEDVQSIVDAVEQLDWVEWVKGQMSSEPTPSVEQNNMAGATDQPVPPPGPPAPMGGPQPDAAPPVPDAAPPAMPMPGVEAASPVAPAVPPAAPPQMQAEEKKEDYVLPAVAGMAGRAIAAGAAGNMLADKNSKSHSGAKQVLHAKPSEKDRYEMPDDIPVDDEELEIDISLEDDEEEVEGYEADADMDIDIDLEEDDEEEEVDDYQAKLYQALEGSAVEEPIGAPSGEGDVADDSLMKFSRMRQNLRSERSRYSRLEKAHLKLKKEVAAIQAEKVAAQRYGKLQSLSVEYSMDLGKESERCSKMTSEQFEDHLDVIAENYSRIPLANRTPQLFTPDVSAVKSDQYARETADAAVAHCMREREKGNNISYAEALEAVRVK